MCFTWANFEGGSETCANAATCPGFKECQELPGVIHMLFFLLWNRTLFCFSYLKGCLFTLCHMFCFKII